jgi:hypothetical protein
MITLLTRIAQVPYVNPERVAILTEEFRGFVRFVIHPTRLTVQNHLTYLVQL